MVIVMKKLRIKPSSMRDATFALALCGCASPCDCSEMCSCPIAPTHQIGLNVESQNKSRMAVAEKDTSPVNAWARDSIG